MFDPKDLYTFSDKILGFYYSEEAARRSVVSRSYYAVFLILREKLRRNALESARKNYSWKNVVLNNRKVYEDLR